MLHVLYIVVIDLCFLIVFELCVLICSDGTNLSDYWALEKLQLICFSDEVREAVRERSRVDIVMGRKFYRLKLKNKVYHSKEYRNSYGYSEDGTEKYTLIKFFISLPPSTFAVV